MKSEERPSIYLVILNREDVLGEFTHEEDAQVFAYICALHGDAGDVVEYYETKAGFEVAE